MDLNEREKKEARMEMIISKLEIETLQLVGSD